MFIAEVGVQYFKIYQHIIIGYPRNTYNRIRKGKYRFHNYSKIS